ILVTTKSLVVTPSIATLVALMNSWSRGLRESPILARLQLTPTAWSLRKLLLALWHRKKIASKRG
ncbi:MAG: hypothetical protein M3N48_05235, partial [Verrucomicrobiota bacterium]|nr:hypothetical protein [Verrucomicrobiota bacterium]